MNLANRAASAETAVTQRHLRRLWALPGTQLAVVAWPSTRRDRLFGSWHYWWQAHLLDCLVDAQLRVDQAIQQVCLPPVVPAAEQPVAPG